ncbi:ABC transporter substrate-binding protein [Heliobacterium chlorum]|uniref:ABC transporter substrate-binding protein n=1 Tax=Heliobacterium chlorum TaxID=2698 RepID=A0ABR7T7K1_HELCL|nr:ABC transporter substrate-binding protein [Heliobacterium chlorum]MBC9786345.1 ABC transporter substrate-binding protein [Heliobacterium chlorum]
MKLSFLHKYKKLIGAGLVSAMLLPVLAGCNSSTTGSSGSDAVGAGNEIAIGLTAPLSGDYAEYGTVFKNSLDLAIEKVNAKGGINGKTLKLIPADSKADPKEAANIAQKFVSDKKVIAVVGDFTSTAAMAGSPIYQKGGLVQFSPTSSHPDFTKQGDYIFRNIATQEVEAPLLAEYAVKDLKKKNIAVIYIKNDWGIVTKDYFVKGVQDQGGNIIDVEEYLPEQGKDFSAILTKIREKNPDLLFLANMYTDAALVAQQARKTGFNVDLMGTGSLYSGELLRIGGPAVEGLYLTCSFHPEDPRPEVQEFVKEYTAKYGIAPTQFAAQAYDAIHMIVAALESGATDRQSLRDKLAATKDFPGVTGKTTFDANRNVDKKPTKLVIQQGKYVLYKH